MKVSNTRTVYEQVELSQKAVEEVFDRAEVTSQRVFSKFRKTLFEEWKLPHDAFIRNGHWYVEVEYHTSHSWSSDKELREVTPEEQEVMDSISSVGQSLAKKRLVG